MFIYTDYYAEEEVLYDKAVEQMEEDWEKVAEWTVLSNITIIIIIVAIVVIIWWE